MSVRGYREETGLIYYAAMMIITAFYFLFFHASAQGVGILALGWSGITALRALWFFYLIRAVEFEENGQNRAQLPQRILRMMQGYKDRENGFRALRAVDASSYILMALIGLYLCWGVYVSFTVPDIPALRFLQNDIDVFLTAEGAGDLSLFPIILHNIFLQTALVLMACFAFWQALGFGFISRYRAVVLGMSLGLFALTLLWNFIFVQGAVSIPEEIRDIWIGYGAGRFDILQSMGEIPAVPLSSLGVRIVTMGWIGAGLLYATGIYAVVIISRGFWNGHNQRLYACAGIAVLCTMFLCDIFFERSVYQMPLWVAGWSALAVCRAGAAKNGRKQHRIH